MKNNKEYVICKGKFNNDVICKLCNHHYPEIYKECIKISLKMKDKNK